MDHDEYPNHNLNRRQERDFRKTDRQSDSRHRVAFDLLEKILERETGKTIDRMHLLTLYQQCLSVIHGGPAEHAVEKSNRR